MNFDEMRPTKFEDLDDSLKEIVNECRKVAEDEKDMQKYGSTSEWNEGNFPILSSDELYETFKDSNVIGAIAEIDNFSIDWIKKMENKNA